MSHFLFKKNETYLKVRKYIDWATILVTSILIIVGFKVFHYSLLFVIYFFISLGIISYLVNRLRKIEEKKQNAENVIKVLKNEETVLENETDRLNNQIKVLQNEKSS